MILQLVFKQLNKWFQHIAKFSAGVGRWGWKPHTNNIKENYYV